MKELVNNVETLFNVFVPGALCVWFYTKLSLKKIEYQGFLSLSIAFGFTIKYIIDYADHLLGRFTIKGFSYRCCLYCNWYCMLRLVLQNQKLYSGKKVV